MIIGNDIDIRTIHLNEAQTKTSERGTKTGHQNKTSEHSIVIRRSRKASKQDTNTRHENNTSQQDMRPRQQKKI